MKLWFMPVSKAGRYSLWLIVVALIKNKDYSILVLACVLIGAIIVYFGASQIVGELTSSN